MVEQQRPEDCLAGGGLMGELMRSTDWSRTAFGPIADWPQSLRTAISIMLESRFAMVVAWGQDFRFFYNDRYTPVLGKKHPTSLARPGAVIFPEVWPVIGPEFERVRRGEAIAVEDWHLPLDRNGYLENCWFTLSYSPIRDETGGVGGVLAVVAETTGRVESERRLATLRDLARRAGDAKTAEEACQNAAGVLEQNPIDVPFASFYLVEPGAEWARRIASVRLDANTDANPDRIYLGAADDSAASRWPLARVVTTGKAEVLNDLPERFGPLPGGAYPEPSHTALLLPLSRPGLDHPYGILVAGVSPRRALDDRYRDFFDLAADPIATAISNALAFEAERKRAEGLAEIDKAKTAFFSNVSHEFRTPLTLLLGPTEDALRRPIPALTGENLQTVHRNALRLLKLVNSLLDFSRIEAGRVQAVYQSTDLANFTEDLVSGFRSAIERGGLSLKFSASPKLPTAFVDRQMWEKIVLNLLSNAFKFTFEGEIAVSLTGDRNGFELAVVDTGVGVPAKELPRLFERFHRVEGTRSRTHEGTGIGLALVQELVQLHGGSIQVKSVEGKGSAFTVSIPSGSSHLPQDRVGSHDVLASTALGVAPFLEEALRWVVDDAGSHEPQINDLEATGRILIADDNADMRRYLTNVLSPRWTVEAVADGHAALAAIRTQMPDVVLSDIMMPGLDGLELLRTLRAAPATEDIRVILLSARAGEEARIEGLDAGANDYLTKPFSARELAARVNSQVAIARAHRRISEHRNDLYRLLMQAPAPICVIRGQELRFEMANSLYLQIAGRNEVVGRTWHEVFPEFRGNGMDELLLGVMKTGEPLVAKEMLVRLDREGHGEVKDTWFTVTWAPLANTAGAIDRVMCFCNDVTDQVIARSEAEKAGRAKDEFLAMLGHELRNPLAPIVTALHLMKESNENTFGMERRIIDRQVKYMVRLVDDLLDVARITRGKIQLYKKPVELAAVVAEAVEIASPMMEERSQQLSIDVARTGLLIHADEVRVAQVVANLLTNASKFTGTGGQIRVIATATSGEVQLRVRDNGKGIAPELLPKIFDIFVQGERSTDESRAGLGLGLSIVKSLTELHGGHVGVYSEGEGKGSEFTVSLPLLTSVKPAASASSERSALKPAVIPSARHRVLIVDDNRDGAELMGIALGLEGHEIRTSFDGPTALNIAAEFEPTVVLLDLGLPVMDGYEIAQRLRLMRGGTKMRLVAVSGYGLESDRRRTAQSGFDLHLVKPVDFDVVDALLKQWSE